MTPVEHSAIAAREVADRLERAHKNWCACDGMDHNQTKMVGYDIVKLIEDNVDVILASLRALAPAPADDTFQSRVKPWLDACFGPVNSADKIERNHRFLEEALELVQACGCSRDEAHQLVDYVYGRNQGDINQEVGGVMVTLAALCLANGFDMHAAAETELARVWTKVEQIRAKQAAKPKHSPLPAAPADQSDAGRDGVIEGCSRCRYYEENSFEESLQVEQMVETLRDKPWPKFGLTLTGGIDYWRDIFRKALRTRFNDPDAPFRALANAPSETVGRGE